MSNLLKMQNIKYSCYFKFRLISLFTANFFYFIVLVNEYLSIIYIDCLKLPNTHKDSQITFILS